MSFLSSENPKRSSQSLKFPKDNDYLNEKIRSLKKSRSGYVSAMTRVINKLTEQINLNSDVKEIQRYEFKLQNAIQNIRDITAKLHEVVIDEKEQENVLNFCTEQEFRVIQIRKSINNYTHQLTNANIQKRNSVTEVGVATLIILFIPHDLQSIILCLTLTLLILLNKILVNIQALM